MPRFDIKQKIMVCVKVVKMLGGEKVLSCTLTSNIPVYLKQRGMQASDLVITSISRKHVTRGLTMGVHGNGHEFTFLVLEHPGYREVQVSSFKYNSHTYNKTNEMHQFLKFIFGIELYRFRTVSLPIIRSLALYTQQ